MNYLMLILSIYVNHNFFLGPFHYIFILQRTNEHGRVIAKIKRNSEMNWKPKKGSDSFS